MAPLTVPLTCVCTQCGAAPGEMCGWGMMFHDPPFHPARIELAAMADGTTAAAPITDQEIEETGLV